jgi:hypothetical protein
MHINNEWDKEYREQREAFRRYQADAQAAQTENHAAIARLKDNLATVEEERDRLEDELGRYQRELHALRERLAVSESMRMCGGGGEVVKLEEELSLLRQQVKAYEEDFEAEKREKERLRDEKHSAAVRYEAEKTSLQLQLDRCQADLAHFTAEANRLSQQLKLKNQYEEDRYREHLENKGFVARCPGSGLPPLDPYVEIDQKNVLLPPHRAVSNGLAGRSRNTMHNGPLHNGHVTHPQLVTNFAKLSVGNEYVVSPARLNNGGLLPPGNGSRRQSANVSGSCRLVARGVEKDVASIKTNSDGLSSSDSSSSVDDSDGLEECITDPSPPPASKGHHTCPHCARRFQDKKTFQQHRDRCLAELY